MLLRPITVLLATSSLASALPPEKIIYKVVQDENAMQQYSYTKWRIEGYTDNTGSDAVNLKLSKERAAAVRDYFISKGISPDRITSEGYGKTNYIATNNTAAGRAQNRRTEIKLVN